MSRKITHEEALQIEALKKRGAFKKIVTGETVSKVSVSIAVLCNSGPQLKDRLHFYWHNVADVVHPVLRHGGIVRLSTQNGLFDSSIEPEVNEALRFMEQSGTQVNRFVVGGHYDCSFCCEKGMSLVETVIQSHLGYRNFRKLFSHKVPDVQFFFHMDWTSFEGEKKHPMETFQVDPDALSAMIIEQVDFSKIHFE